MGGMMKKSYREDRARARSPGTPCTLDDQRSIHRNRHVTGPVLVDLLAAGSKLVPVT